MAEIPLTEQVKTEKDNGKDVYDVQKGEELAGWVHGLQDHAGELRRKLTRESKWEQDWEFLKGEQWSDPLPTYRRPIVMNSWRRAFHIVEATLLGGRPTIKLVPQGGKVPDNELKVWQDALWAVLRKEHVMEEIYPAAQSWGLVCEGGFIKVGFGRWGEVEGEPPDVQVSAPHPAKVYPDPDCTDLSLAQASYILYRDSLDLKTISDRYPENGWRAKPDNAVSLSWPDKPPSWALAPKTDGSTDTIAPAGGWTVTGQYRRARAIVVECWIDDPKMETYEKESIVNVDTVTGTPEVRVEKLWRRAYPYGRLITCTKDVVLRDIPNPYGKAMGWAHRWPFVFIPGAIHPHTLWRPGLLSGHEEMQRAINKSLSLLLENYIKVTNALVIADESAMEDEDWDLLSLVPGGKFRKRQGTDFNIIFPQGLPPHAFQFPDYMIRKLEESVGIHDPPLAPGQAVAAKTVAFMQQKGSFLLGIIAMLGDQGLERLGARVIGLMRDRYLPGRAIPYFEGESIANPDEHKIKELPASVSLRVEATSAYQEIMMAGMAMAAAGQQAQAKGRPK